MGATKRIEQKAATRTKVLDCARELFRRNGYEGTGMRAVAKAAGLSTGAIFGQFADKAELFAAAMPDFPVPDPRALLLELAQDVHVNNLSWRAKTLYAALYGIGDLRGAPV